MAVKSGMTQEDYWISLLVGWWRYESEWSPVRGFPKVCPSANQYRASRQYDGMQIPDRDGKLCEPTADVDARGKVWAKVASVLNAMQPIDRAALHSLAKARATGIAVWGNPMLPADNAERAEVTARALELFGMMIDV